MLMSVAEQLSIPCARVPSSHVVEDCASAGVVRPFHVFCPATCMLGSSKCSHVHVKVKTRVCIRGWAVVRMCSLLCALLLPRCLSQELHERTQVGLGASMGVVVVRTGIVLDLKHGSWTTGAAFLGGGLDFHVVVLGLPGV